MINVGGFLFEDEATATQARKEEEGVRFIKEKSALNNPEVVLKLYKTILQQKLFVTPVGLRFLMELQSFLLESPDVNKEDIPALEASAYMKSIEVSENASESKKEQSQKKRTLKATEKLNARVVQNGSYKHAFYVTLFFAIVFGFSVLGMFAIAEVSSDNVNILNYREKIINQYEQWELELEVEEERLEEWEADLSERESMLGGENAE